MEEVVDVDLEVGSVGWHGAIVELRCIRGLLN